MDNEKISVEIRLFLYIVQNITLRIINKIPEITNHYPLTLTTNITNHPLTFFKFVIYFLGL